ncbi:MAG: chemotaxis protein CheD [Bacteroidales bacterium]|nr:chemotaxis protein CheD [Bacteroidales bacterium]
MDNLVITHYLFPAELFAEAQPHVVSTVLGSCVAVCLYDTQLKIGGINHYMLPLWNGTGLASPKYGNIAINKLIERMEKLGSNKANLVAKVFGGGNVLSSSNNTFSIGKRNAQLALDMLAEHKIPIIAQSLGGDHGRQILFNTHTNEVRQKYV